MALLVGVLLSLSSIAWIGIQPSPYRYATQVGTQGGAQGKKQLGTPPTGSCYTNFSIGSCENAFDSDNDTYIEQNVPNNHFVYWDFGSGNSKDISSFSVYLGALLTKFDPLCGGSSSAFLDYSDDGSSWTEVADSGTIFFYGNPNEEFYTWGANVDAGSHRYWRIRVHEDDYGGYCDPDGLIRIREFVLSE